MAFISAKRLLIYLGCFLMLSGCCILGTFKYSALWGKRGEKWSTQSRLPDFSCAGYRQGDSPIPNLPIVANLKMHFDAAGDGISNDTKALQTAVEKAPSGTLFIPAGTYILSDVIQVNRSHFTIRGAGQGKTILQFTKSLFELHGEADYGQKWALLKYGDAERAGVFINAISSESRRGEDQIIVDNPINLEVGQIIRIRMTNPRDNALGCHLYADQGCLNPERQAWHAGQIFDWIVGITDIQDNVIRLNRPLRTDIKLNWKPEIWSFEPTIEEVGLEHMTIEFPNQPYAGHHKEAGYHAILFSGVHNGWIKNIRIIDCDRAITLYSGTSNVTVENVLVSTKHRKPLLDKDRAEGHYGICMGGVGTQDNLVSNCRLQATFVHDLAVQNFANGNVYSNIETKGGSLDHHGGAPFENLYTQILITGSAQNLFKCGGNRKDEPNAGARTTWWNIVANKGDFPRVVKKLSNGKPKYPQINIVGIGAWSQMQDSSGAWIESWPGKRTRPLNLYEAQQKRKNNNELTSK